MLLAVSGCGDNGEGPPTGVTVTELVDFGQTDCGSTAIAQPVIVTNRGDAEISFEATLAKGAASPYQVFPAAATVSPGSQLVLMVHPRAIPQTSAVTANLYGDTLTVTTSFAGDSPHEVALQQTAHGAILQLSVPSISFPSPLAIDASEASALTITNAGNVATDVTVKSNGFSFTFAPTGTQALAPGASIAGTLTLAPAAIGALAEQLSLEATGPLCAPLPSLAATGTSTVAGKAVAAVPAARSPRKPAGTVCVLLAGGRVACGGDEQFGIRGAGALPLVSGFNLVQTVTGPLDGVVELASGRGMVCARRQQGQVYCWGEVAQVGPRFATTGTPFATLMAEGAISLSLAYDTACVVTNPGGVVSCWGGFGPHTEVLQGATAVALNGKGGYALLSDGTVMSFGSNQRGERGSAVASEDPPSAVTGLTDVIAIAGSGHRFNADKRHGCALESDGTVWCWGANHHGQLGDGTRDDSAHPDPVQVRIDATTMLTGVTKITTGRVTSCAVTAGSVYCWGRQHGTYNRGDRDANEFATLVPGITTAVAVTTRNRTTCITLANGEVRCAGQVNGVDTVTPVALPEFELP